MEAIFEPSVNYWFSVLFVAYRLYTVVPRLVKFVDQLTNWYVRMNRRRLKGDGGVTDCTAALHTLLRVLFSMTKVMVCVVVLSFVTVSYLRTHHISVF